MSEKSILLGLDGSAQCRYAAELAWAMSKTGEMRVDAQHVVDSLASWDFLSFDIAGFIGSGPYFEAHDVMRTTLMSVGQNLVDVYRTLALQYSVEGEAYLDEGATIREICLRAKDHSLVVLGHQSSGMQSPDEDQRKFPRRSIAETLTQYCPVPLLVMQDRCRLWTKSRLLLGPSVVPPELLKSYFAFGKELGLETSVRFVYDSAITAGDKDVQSSMADFKKTFPDAAKNPIEVKSMKDVSEYMKDDAESDPDTLLVVPIVESDGVRRSAFGVTPDVLVRYMSHPAVLFWMVGSDVQPSSKSSKSVSSAV